MTNVAIRKAQPGDIEKLLPLYEEFIEYHKQFGESYEKVYKAGHILQNYHTQQLKNDKALVVVAGTWGDNKAAEDTITPEVETASDKTLVFADTLTSAEIKAPEDAMAPVDAMAGGAVVGFCIGLLRDKPPVYVEQHIGEIGSIAVKIGYQRRGIGERLLREVFAWFKLHKVRRVETAFALGNMKSMNFWIKMGFNPFLQNIYTNLEV